MNSFDRFYRLRFNIADPVLPAVCRGRRMRSTTDEGIHQGVTDEQ